MRPVLGAGQGEKCPSPSKKAIWAGIWVEKWPWLGPLPSRRDLRKKTETDRGRQRETRGQEQTGRWADGARVEAETGIV